MVKGTPMARSTWDGWSDPEVQAEPEEAQMPNSSIISRIDFTFDKFEADIARVGKAFIRSPFTRLLILWPEVPFPACRAAV